MLPRGIEVTVYAGIQALPGRRSLVQFDLGVEEPRYNLAGSEVDLLAPGSSRCLVIPAEKAKDAQPGLADQGLPRRSTVVRAAQWRRAQQHLFAARPAGDGKQLLSLDIF